MRLNYDLIRDILLKIEEITDGNVNIFTDGFAESTFPNENPDIVDFHLRYLRQRGFIYPTEYDSFFIGLTPTGYDYLNSVRDCSVWNSVKQTLKKCVSPTLDVVKAIAISIIKENAHL